MQCFLAMEGARVCGALSGTLDICVLPERICHEYVREA